MADTKVGVVTHYYDKIGVGIIKLDTSLKVGDTIKIVGKEGEFRQEVLSIQVEHQNVENGKRGDEVGIKLDNPVKEKDEVFKV